MKSRLCCLTILFLSSSCVAPLESDKSVRLSENYICRMEKVTGSNRPTRVCRSREQIEKGEVEAEDFMRRNERLSTMPTQ